MRMSCPPPMSIITLCMAILGTSGCKPQTEDSRTSKPVSIAGNSQSAPGTGSGSAGEVKNASGDDKPKAGKVLGIISAETTDQGWIGKSTYAELTEAGMLKSVAIIVYQDEILDTSFKKIKSWECKPCSGDKDPYCTASTAAAIPKLFKLTFTKPFVANPKAKAGEDGFPKEDSNALTGTNADTTDAPGLAYLLSTDALGSAQNSGSVNFAAGKRPAKVGDEWEATVDLKWKDGKTYKATLKGPVVKAITDNPSAPADCKLEDKKYPFPTYE